jgi:prepilin-type N-terminal cleavage/methylation domain-containing protein
MKVSKQTANGFTLIEMLLVMVIVSAIIVGIATYSQQKTAQMRLDRAVLQMQQILNAGLAYYLNNSKWPASIADDLQGDGKTGSTGKPGGYLPGPSSAVTIVSPWAGQYIIGNTGANLNAPGALFAVCTTISAGDTAPSTAKILAGRLPMAYVVDGDHSAECATDSSTTSTGVATLPAASECTAAPCTVVATVNVPGQNLNNARAVNYAGVYHHGACVAAPKCPAKMKPSVLVAPVSVSGMFSTNTEVYPISSFTAYVSVDSQTPTPNANPAACTGDTSTPAACPTGGPDDKYWRVCLQIITQKGPVVYNSDTAKDATTILAITRCMPQGEDEPDGNQKGNTITGSDFTVFSY